MGEHRRRLSGSVIARLIVVNAGVFLHEKSLVEIVLPGLLAGRPSLRTMS